MGTIHIGNDQSVLILGYGDLVQGNITINMVYYVKGLNHNLFLVGQFYDADLEVAFWRSTCFVRNLHRNDLLIGNRGFDLYTISPQETTSSTLICFMAKASPTQAWLWHRRLSHINFDYINLISKKDIVIGLPKLKYVKDQLYLPQTARQAVRNTNVIKLGMYQIDTRPIQTRAPQLPQTSRNIDPRVSTTTGVIHRTNVSIPQLRSTQMKDKVVPKNSQVKFKKTEVEDHHRIFSNSNETKSVTACNNNLKSRTSNVNAVCATCEKCMFNSNHDACVSKFINDVNARTNKPKVVLISTKKPKSQANKSVAIPRKKTVASDSTIQKSKSYFWMLYENTNKAWKWWIEK
ncbi:integrase, catalytic region, zinc finger, CCHC-type containing protein [Tanacetum coccineum]